MNSCYISISTAVQLHCRSARVYLAAIPLLGPVVSLPGARLPLLDDTYTSVKSRIAERDVPKMTISAKPGPMITSIVKKLTAGVSALVTATWINRALPSAVSKATYAASTQNNTCCRQLAHT